LLRELIVQEDAWEVATFDSFEDAPISYSRPLVTA